MFVNVSHFRPSLIFTVKPGGKVPLIIIHSNGRLLALLAINRLGRKLLMVTNTLAYYRKELMTAVKNL